MYVPCVCLGTVQYCWISNGLVIVQLSAVFCPSVQYLSFFCEAFSRTILDSNSFSLFHSGQVFHELVCPLTVVLPQIFFNLTTLFSYPVFFCLFHAPLDVVVHLPVFLRSFRFKSVFFLSFLLCRTPLGHGKSEYLRLNEENEKENRDEAAQGEKL